MNIKILYHFMPWEIDYALLTFTQLKKSKYYIDSDINIEIDSVLNLSSYIINWDDSKLPKEYFIDKYKNISKLLVDYKHNFKVFEKNQIYGHLDLQKESKAKHVDYYINICPDMYFSEHLLSYLIQTISHIKNKYFVVTPQISKLWDNTWDEITNSNYINIPYKKWDNVDVFDIRNNLKINNEDIELYPVQNNKWAGWFDLYNKALWEDLIPVHKDWFGYGPHDWYSMMLSEYAKQNGIDFQQYLLKGQTIFEYSVGPLKNSGFSAYYKNLIVKNNIPDQRKQFEVKMNEYLNKGIQTLKQKNIL